MASTIGYGPLRAANHTRLLQIKPAIYPGAPLESSLIEVSLDNMPAYEALSYAWGEPIRSHPLTIQDDRHSWAVPITETLRLALVELRPEFRPRNLWVDQLCINQVDVVERGQQVSNMAAIYQKARRTIVWLGPETDDIWRAWGLVSSVSSAAYAWLPEMSYFEDDNPVAEDGWGYYNSLPPSTSPTWPALDAVLDRAWFSRSWVMQEVAVASYVTLRCGTQEVSWGSLAWALKSYCNRAGPRSSLLASAGCYTVISFEKHRRNFLSGQQLEPTQHVPLYQILGDVRNLNSTDPRDKVYAALSLAHPTLRLSIDIDYSLSVQEVYRQAALALIKESSKFDEVPPLTFLALSGDANIPGLPSWVPDWTKPASASRLNNYGCPFKASGKRNLNLSMPSADLLSVRGLVVDSVRIVSEAVPSPETHIIRPKFADESAQRARILVSWLKLAGLMSQSSRSTLNHSPGDKMTAVMDTITADGLRSPASLRSPEVFTEWTEYIGALAGSPSVGSNSGLDPDVANFDGMCSECQGRKFIVSTNGRFGLAPRQTCEGDLICVLYGGRVPFVLRKDAHGYRNVGECYLNGIMYGESLEWKGLEEQDFVIY